MPGLIYTKVEGGIVSIVVPDDEQELAMFRLADDEEMLVVSPQAYANALGGGDLISNGHAGLQALVNHATGKTPPPPRVAVVENGIVVGLLAGYLSRLAPVPGCDLVPSDCANVGDTYADGVFTPPPPIEESGE